MIRYFCLSINILNCLILFYLTYLLLDNKKFLFVNSKYFFSIIVSFMKEIYYKNFWIFLEIATNDC